MISKIFYENVAVFVRLGKILIVLALVAALGAHWALLQTVAWTTMLANNLQSHSLSQAVTDTFDGNHPCPLCRAIAAAKKSEKKSEAVSSTVKTGIPAGRGRVHVHFAGAGFRLFARKTFRRLIFSKTAAAAAARIFRLIHHCSFSGQRRKTWAKFIPFNLRTPYARSRNFELLKMKKSLLFPVSFNR